MVSRTLGFLLLLLLLLVLSTNSVFYSFQIYLEYLKMQTDPIDFIFSQKCLCPYISHKILTNPIN